jgi:penicillin-binding protein 1A
MEPDGALRAMVGGRDYGASQFNRATEAMRQPGSSFKPYVYLTALMTGKFKPTTIVVDSPVCIGNWCPHNYGGSYAGSLPLANALARSLNTVAVKLSIAIGNGNPKAGRAKIVQTARSLGITAPLEDTPSLPIGADEVTLLEHAAAYAAFVNGGKKTLAYTAMEIDNRHGDLLYRHDRNAPPQEQAVPFDKVVELGSMMRKVVEEGTGRAAQLGDGREVIGKTGTTNGFKDAWFCGYSGAMGGCVWYGNDDGEPMNNMTGGSLPARTWHDIMAYAHQGVPLKHIVGMAQAPVAEAAAAGTPIKPLELGAPQRPATLSKGAVEALGSIETKIKALSLGKRGDAFQELAPLSPARSHSAAGGSRTLGGAVE